MSKVKLIYINMLLASLVACGDGPHQPLIVLSENNSAETNPQDPDIVSFVEVKPIFKDRCSRCHPAFFPPNWLDYAEARKFADNGRLAARTLGPNPTMPQIGSPEAALITAEERALIAEWIASGAAP